MKKRTSLVVHNQHGKTIITHHRTWTKARKCLEALITRERVNIPRIHYDGNSDCHGMTANGNFFYAYITPY